MVVRKLSGDVGEASRPPAPRSGNAGPVEDVIAGLADLDAIGLRLQWRNHLGGTPSAASEHHVELIGCPISMSFATFCVCLELRSLPSAGVTRFPRCRVGGGALSCLCACLRPPLKLDVQFSRIQLS